MKNIIAALVFVNTFCSMAQTTMPTTVQVNAVSNITSAGTVIDNRSSFSAQSTIHTFCAAGTGTWSVMMQYSDISNLGPWTNFADGTASISNTSNAATCGQSAGAFGGASGYHLFLRFNTSGTVNVSYSGQKALWIPLSTGGGGGSSSFNGISSGTNTTAEMFVGSGASIGFAGTGTINANEMSGVVLSSLSTGILKLTSGVPSIAVSGTDYAPATSGSSVLYGNGAGGFSNVTVSTGLSFITGVLTNTGLTAYPGAGVPLSTGSAWGSSYTVGTTGTDLCCVLSSGLLPVGVLPEATSSTFGVIKPDNSTITVTAGVITSIGGGGGFGAGACQVVNEISTTFTITWGAPYNCFDITVNAAATIALPTPTGGASATILVNIKNATPTLNPITWSGPVSLLGSPGPQPASNGANYVTSIPLSYDTNLGSYLPGAPVSSNCTGLTAGQIPATIAAGCSAAATQTNINAVGFGTGGGSANAQTVTLSPAITSYTVGLTVSWLPTNANTTTTPTLAVNGLGVTTIVRAGGALNANDILTTAIATVKYDGTNFELENPQTSPSGSGPTNSRGSIGAGGTSAPTCNSGNNGLIYWGTDSAYQGLCNGSSWYWSWSGLSNLTFPLTSNTSWINQTSATLTQVGGALVLKSTTNSGSNPQGQIASVPSTPYTVVGCFVVDYAPVPLTGSAQIGAAGLFWSNGTTTGASTEFVFFSSIGSSYSLFAERQNAFNLAGADTVSHWVNWNGSAGNGGLYANNQPICVGVRDDGTNKAFAVSRDGIPGTTAAPGSWYVAGTETHTNFITPTNIGYFVDSLTSSQAVAMQLVGWTVYNSAIF